MSKRGREEEDGGEDGSMVNIDPREVTLAVMQYLDESGYSSALLALQRDASLPYRFPRYTQTDPSKGADRSVVSAAKEGDWPFVLGALEGVSLPVSVAARLHAHIAMELSAAGRVDEVNALIGGSQALESVRRGECAAAGSAGSEGGPAVPPPFDNPTPDSLTEWYRVLGTNLSRGRAIDERNAFEGGSIVAGRERIAAALGATLHPAPRPSRLLAALGDAVKHRLSRGVIRPGPPDRYHLFGDLLPRAIGSGGVGAGNGNDDSGQSAENANANANALAMPRPAGVLAGSKKFSRRSRPTAVAYAPGGRFVAVGGPDGLVEVFDVGGATVRLAGVPVEGVKAPPGDDLFAFQARDDFILVGAAEGSAVTALAMARTGDGGAVLVCGTAAGRAAVYSLPAGTLVAEFPSACSCAITCVAVADGAASAADVSAAAGGADGGVVLLGVRSRSVVARLTADGSPGGDASAAAGSALGCVFLARGTIATAYADGSACLFDAAGGSWSRVSSVPRDANEGYVCAAPLPDRVGAFAMVSIGGAVRVVDAGPAARRPLLAAFSVPGVGEASAVAVAADGSRALVCGTTGKVHHVRLWSSPVAPAGCVDAEPDTGCKGGCILAACDPADPTRAVTVGADAIMVAWAAE